MNRVYLFPDRAPKPKPTSGDWETEYAACSAFDRPARTNLSSPPYYPGVPTPWQVKFSLKFQ